MSDRGPEQCFLYHCSWWTYRGYIDIFQDVLASKGYYLSLLQLVLTAKCRMVTLKNSPYFIIVHIFWSYGVIFGYPQYSVPLKELLDHVTVLHSTLLPLRLKWAASWQNQQNGSALSEDSGQPGHPPSLLWVFAGRTVILLVLSWGGSNWYRIIFSDVLASKGFLFQTVFVFTAAGFQCREVFLKVFPYFIKAQVLFFWSLGINELIFGYSECTVLHCSWYSAPCGHPLMYLPTRPEYRWATTWQNQQNEDAPSEDSDQHGQPPSLIRVFAVRMKKAWDLSYPFSTQQRLRLDWADAQADLSLCWAHIHFVGFVMSRPRLQFMLLWNQLAYSRLLWRLRDITLY